MFFVSDVPNNGQNVLDIMVTKPNRERQKLMREQNILKQVAAHTWGWAGPWPASRTSSIFFFLIYMYSLYFWLCWVFVAARGLSLASPWGGFPCCRARALGRAGCRSRGSRRLEHRLSRCGLRA